MKIFVLQMQCLGHKCRFRAIMTSGPTVARCLTSLTKPALCLLCCQPMPAYCHRQAVGAGMGCLPLACTKAICCWNPCRMGGPFQLREGVPWSWPELGSGGLENRLKGPDVNIPHSHCRFFKAGSSKAAVRFGGCSPPDVGCVTGPVGSGSPSAYPPPPLAHSRACPSDGVGGEPLFAGFFGTAVFCGPECRMGRL